MELTSLELAINGLHKASLQFVDLLFQRLANRNEEDGALVFGVRRKEVDHFVIEKGQAGGAQVLSVGCQVNLASDGPGLKLDTAITAVPVSI